RLLMLIQALFVPQEGEGAALHWAKEILAALLILAFFWMLAHLVTAILNKWGKRLAHFTTSTSAAAPSAIA
ncbi:MAG: hypothetical protein ABIY52_08260, partial [Gemmatimonadaceae bacterium]